MFPDHKPYAGTLLHKHTLFHAVLTAALKESSNLISTLLIKKLRHRKLTGLPRTCWQPQGLKADRLLPEPHARSSDAVGIRCSLTNAILGIQGEPFT